MSSPPRSPSGPSSSPSSPSPSLPAWHFPFGPSSVYHSRERAKARHSRFKSSYTPRAPVLSTEKRVHHRAHNSSLGSSGSPPLGECSRSPLSRFPSYSPATMAAHQNDHGPLTPHKTSRASTSSLQDSPFSDYFSDDARSTINHHGAIASDEIKALLVRMNQLQSQLMREPSETLRQSIHVVERKLGEIEVELAALHSQTRMPDELDGSAVFTREEKNAVQPPAHSRGPSTQSVDSSAVFSDDAPTPENYKAERDWLLVRTQDLLKNLDGVTGELRQRVAEVKDLNELHAVTVEEKDTQIEQLRSENEGLRQDLGFEYSELLFLKLQMKSLECDVSELREEKVHGPPTTEAERSRRTKKNQILSEMDRWRTDSDWRDVSARFKRRRSKYGIATSPISNEDSSFGNAAPDWEWQLETQREDRGGVTSLTITRVNSNGGGSHNEDTPSQLHTVTLNGTTVEAAPPTTTTTSPPEFPTTPSPPPYVEASTQTPFPFPPALDESSHSSEPRHGDGGIDSDSDSDDECAITTSLPSEAGDDPCEDVDDEPTIRQAPTPLHTPEQQSGWKPAWKELWAGLQSLSGMHEDDDDDEEEEEEEEDRPDCGAV